MTSGIQLFHRCPYCPRGQGDVYVHTERMIDWLLEFEHSECISYETDYLVHPAGGTLLFNPGTVQPSACKHLVSASFNPELYDATEEAQFLVNGTTIDYDHPWFATQGELKNDANCFAFESFMRESADADDPWRSSTPFIESWTKRWIVDETERDDRILCLYGFGFAKYAALPETFFEELGRRYSESRVRAQQWQASRDRSAHSSEC